MDSNELFAFIKESIQKNHPELSIKINSKFTSELALDSVDYMELISSLETKYKIIFEDQDLLNAPKDVTGLINLVLEKNLCR